MIYLKEEVLKDLRVLSDRLDEDWDETPSNYNARFALMTVINLLRDDQKVDVYGYDLEKGEWVF